ncbi:hypothetical protein J6590_050759 [Homalodisca vitripennis]|nr:hypothetical protein J6590_050759 [Homalodisca vitripennis]
MPNFFEPQCCLSHSHERTVFSEGLSPPTIDRPRNVRLILRPHQLRSFSHQPASPAVAAGSPTLSHRREQQVDFCSIKGANKAVGYTEVPTQDIATFLNIPSLSSRRCIQDVMFLYRLINAELDCPDLLEKINFKASFGTRAMNSFTKVAASSSYAANGPMLRIQRLGNNIPSTLDIFIASKSAIKSRLASL